MTKQPLLLKRSFLTALALLSFSFGHAAQAQSVEQFYRGKTITMLVGYAPGGLNDLLARVVSRFMVQHIPGAPNIIVRNMPSAGPIGIANHIYNVADKDGLVIASLDRTGAHLAIRGDPAAKFDPLKFTWLGSAASFEHDAYLLLVNSSHPAKTAEDLKHQGLRANIGSVGAGSTNAVFAILSKEALGLNIEVIKGYRGTGPIFLAMQNGEVDGTVTGISTLNTNQADLWKNGKIRALVQFGRVSRHPDLPEVMTGREAAPTPDALALVKFAELPFSMSRPFIAPPGVQQDRAHALQRAFMETMKDPGFVAELKKIGFDDLSPIDGAAILGLIKEAALTPRSVIEQYNSLEK